MRKVGLEAGADLLERLVLVAEEGEGRRLAVLGDVARMELRRLVARPVEDDEFAVLGGGDRRSRTEQRGCQARG